MLSPDSYPSQESFALNQLDLKLRPHLNLHGGFFIEAGANDGVNQSNTLYFEKNLNWKGILIEPIPELAQQCKENRPDCIGHFEKLPCCKRTKAESAALP
jgi:hypothetical protein